MLNKTMLENLKLANGNRRERTLTMEQIETEIATEVNNLLVRGMLKKNLSKLIISNSCSVPRSYNHPAYYTYYIASLNSQGKIKNIEFRELKCKCEPYGGYYVKADLRVNIIDYNEWQIKDALKQQIFRGRL